MSKNIVEVKEGTVQTIQGLEEAKKTEIEYFGRSNPKSVYNLVPFKLQSALENKWVQKYLIRDEHLLKKKVKPTATLNRLRISFWREYERAQLKNKVMVMSRVYSGIAPKEQFEAYIEDPKQVAWLLKPPIDYVSAMEEALLYGVDRIREILDAPLYETLLVSVKEYDADLDKDVAVIREQEVFNSKNADLVLKTVALLDMRVKGAVVQKIEQKTSLKSENKTVTISSGSVLKDIETTALKASGVPEVEYENAMDAKIKELEGEVKESVKKIQAPYTRSETINIKKTVPAYHEINGMEDNADVNNLVSPLRHNSAEWDEV